METQIKDQTLKNQQGVVSQHDEKIPCVFCGCNTKPKFPKCYECFQLEKLGGAYRMPIGKYKNKTFAYVKQDTGYIDWVECMDDPKGAFRRLLNYVNNF